MVHNAPAPLHNKPRRLELMRVCTCRLVCTSFGFTASCSLPPARHPHRAGGNDALNGGAHEEGACLGVPGRQPIHLWVHAHLLRGEEHDQMGGRSVHACSMGRLGQPWTATIVGSRQPAIVAGVAPHAAAQLAHACMHMRIARGKLHSCTRALYCRASHTCNHPGRAV